MIEYLAIKPIKTPSGTKTYQCEFCHYNTNRRGNLARHIGTVHRKGRNTPSRSPYVRDSNRWNNRAGGTVHTVVDSSVTSGVSNVVKSAPVAINSITTRERPAVRNYVPPPPMPTHKQPITIHIEDEDEEQYEDSSYAAAPQPQYEPPMFTWKTGLTRNRGNDNVSYSIRHPAGSRTIMFMDCRQGETFVLRLLFNLYNWLWF